MKKMNNRGFFLSETIIVATVVTAVVTLLYVVLVGILNNYNKRAYYNNVTSLYAADNVRAMIYDKGISYFVSKLASNPYYNVTCDDFIDASSPGSEELCKFLYNYGSDENKVGSVIIDKVFFTKYDVSSLKGFSDDLIKDGTTTDYIETIPVVKDTNDYRIIVILKERDFSSNDNGTGTANSNAKYWYTTLKVAGDAYE